MTRTYNNTLTRLMQFVFVAMLVFTGLTTTGCGLVDSNESDEITIERVLVEESTESRASNDSQTDEDDGLDDNGTDNPVKNTDN